VPTLRCATVLRPSHSRRQTRAANLVRDRLRVVPLSPAGDRSRARERRLCRTPGRAGGHRTPHVPPPGSAPAARATRPTPPRPSQRVRTPATPPGRLRASRLLRAFGGPRPAHVQRLECSVRRAPRLPLGLDLQRDATVRGPVRVAAEAGEDVR